MKFKDSKISKKPASGLNANGTAGVTQLFAVRTVLHTKILNFYDVLNPVQTIIYLALKIVTSELEPSLEARNAEK